MKKLGILCISLLMTLSLVACGSNDETEKKLKIGIVQISEHESLNIVREACIKKLEELGYDDENSEIIYKNAGGDSTTLKTIVEQFKSDEVDVIVPISTPCAQAAAPYAEDIPVVFAAVSDPVGAGLVSALDDTSGNITGTSNEIQVDQIMDFGLQLYPEIKTLGLLYNPGETNSESSIKMAKQYAEEHGISIVESAITSTADVQTGVENLLDKVDAIFIPNDNTIINAMDIVSSLTKKAKIPTFCGVDTFIKSGGLMNVGIDYEDLGSETGIMVDKVLKDTDVKEIPVKVFKENLNVYINKTTAEAVGLDISNLTSDKKIVYFE